MPDIGHTLASLRIFGDDLDPDEITRLLGRAASKSERKGDVTYGKKTGTKRVAKSGGWWLKAAEREPGDLEAQVWEILDGLTQDLSIWAALNDRYHLDLFCGLFMAESNEGLSLSAQALEALGSRGIELQLDLYDPA